MDEYDYKEMMERNQYFAGLDEEKIERLEVVVSDLYEALEKMTRWVNEGGHNGRNEGINQIFLMGENALARAKGEDHE